jgi:predicted RecB family nuclease
VSDGYDHPSSRYRAMTFRGTESMAAAKVSVTAAMNRTFGVKSYTTNESWLVGGLIGNGEVNTEGPNESPAWRQRIEKARREIEEHRRQDMASKERWQKHRCTAIEIENGIFKGVELWRRAELVIN